MDLWSFPDYPRLESVAFGQAELAPVALIQEKISVEIRYRFGGGFKYFFIFTPTIGKIPILTHIFHRGWFNHQLVVVERVLDNPTF